DINYKAPWLTIIGVVGDDKHTTITNEMDYVIVPFVYRPISQDAGAATTILIRADKLSADLASAVQSELEALDSTVPLSDISTLEATLANTRAYPRFRAILLGIFAGLALLLSAVGIYGVLWQSVLQRTHEIGIRTALGARPRDILRLVIGQGLQLILAGIALG